MCLKFSEASNAVKVKTADYMVVMTKNLKDLLHYFNLLSTNGTISYNEHYNYSL